MDRRWKQFGAAVAVGALGLGVAVAPGAAAPVGWTHEFGSSGNDVIAGVGTAPNGEICAAGTTTGTFPGQTTNTSGVNGFLARFDKNGNQLWLRQLGGAAVVDWYSVAVASNGDCFLAGHYSGTLTGVGASQGSDVLVARYDKKGVLKKLVRLASAQDEQGYGITINSSSMVFVSGWTNGQLGATDPGGADGFIARYDTNLNQKWIRQIGTDGDEWGGVWSVSANSSGDVFGIGVEPLAFPGESNAEADDGFVVKLDKNGNQKWVEQIGAIGAEWVNGWGVVAVDNGGVVVAGVTSGIVSGLSFNGGETDTWVRRYDKNGALQWSNQIGTSGNDYGWHLAVSKKGFVYLTGYTTGAFPGSTNVGDRDWFVAKYDVKTGTPGTLRQLGTPQQDGDEYTGQPIAVTPSGVLLVGSLTFGSVFGHSNAGGADAVLFQLQP